MHENIEQLEEELKIIKEILRSTEREKNEAVNELKAKQKMDDEKIDKELKTKDKLIESLKHDLEKVKKLETKLAEKNILLEKLKVELSTVNTHEALAMELLSEGEKRIRELEAEVEKGKEVETKMSDSLTSQTKEFEKTKVMLKEANLEITSLKKKFHDMSHEKEELKSTSSNPEKLDQKVTSFKEEEIKSLRNEMKRAIEAEENSKKALDDLALALKEVTTESNKVKEMLGLTKAEFEYSKGEEERLKLILKNTKEKYKSLLEEAKKDTDLYKNTAERLRVEAEESLLAWTGKETGFVDCMRKIEKDLHDVQKENNRLVECLDEAENDVKSAKEETSKLRDILKQALNESNVAKEAAEIAKAENSQLKDTLLEKEKAINFLIQENQNYKMNETAAHENINELKRMLFEATMKECHCNEKKKTISEDLKEDKETEQKQKTEEHKEEKEVHNNNNNNQHHYNKGGIARVFSLIMPSSTSKHKDEVVGSEIDDTLKGSIFDTDAANSPEAPEPTPVIISTRHQRKKSSSSIPDDNNLDVMHSDELYPLDTNFDDLEQEGNARKKRALLRRFGDLIKMKGSHKKEPSMDKKELHVDKKDAPADKKESPVKKDTPVDKKDPPME